MHAITASCIYFLLQNHINLGFALEWVQLQRQQDGDGAYRRSKKYTLGSQCTRTALIIRVVVTTPTRRLLARSLAKIRLKCASHL